MGLGFPLCHSRGRVRSCLVHPLLSEKRTPVRKAYPPVDSGSGRSELGQPVSERPCWPRPRCVRSPLDCVLTIESPSSLPFPCLAFRFAQNKASVLDPRPSVLYATGP